MVCVLRLGEEEEGEEDIAIVSIGVVWQSGLVCVARGCHY